MKAIDFTIRDETSGLVYKDSIWLEDDSSFSDAEIEDMKAKRFQDWLKAIQPEGT